MTANVELERRIGTGRRLHAARVLSTPIEGVHSTHIDSNHHFGRHWHDTYGFGFLEHGAQSWWSGHGHVRGYPGEVISTNPGEVHDGRPIGGGTRRWRILYIEVGVMTSVTGRQGDHAEIARPVIRDRELMQTLHRLFARIERWHVHRRERGNDAYALAFEETLADGCVQLLTRHGSAPVAIEAASADLRRVRERLADDALEPPTLADMAAMTGLSRYQVLRSFEKAFGLPPHQWLLRRRVERARALIRAGRPLAAAALDCGFVDQSHMTRVFVRLLGFTPGAWRKAAVT